MRETLVWKQFFYLSSLYSGGSLFGLASSSTLAEQLDFIANGLTSHITDERPHEYIKLCLKN